MRVREREGQLLDGRRASFANVVAGNRDRIPARHLVRAEAKHLRDQRQAGSRRINVRAARDVLLENVVLDRPAERRPRDARSSATTRYIASSVDAVALMVIDVETRSSGIPSRSRACPRRCRSPRPRGRPRPAARGESESIPICVGRSKATDKPGLSRGQQVAGSAHWSPPPCRSRRIAAWSRGGPRYIVGWMPRVNGKRPGSASAVA